ncbi:MAG: RNA polymerase sigma-70 factor [Cyclobacteriaceae bacterium]
MKITKNKHINIDSLLKDVRKGNETAFRTFVEMFYSKMLHFAYSLIHNKTFAEEIVQDVFCSIWQNRKKLQNIKNIHSYLYTSTRNKTISFIRSIKNDIANIPLEELEYDKCSTVENPENLLMSEELFSMLSKEIDQLPEKAQLVYRMIKEENLSYQQVAEALNISPKTVDNHLCNSIKRLRESIAEYLSESGDSQSLKIVE